MFLVHFRPCFQIIERANRVPSLQSCRRITERKPVPHIQIMRAVVNPGDLSKFERVEYQAWVAMRRKPDCAVLILHLRPERMRRMPAKIENRWQRLAAAFRHVEISRYIKPRQ